MNKVVLLFSFFYLMACSSNEQRQRPSDQELMSEEEIKETYKSNSEAFFGRAYLHRLRVRPVNPKIVRLEILGLIKHCQVAAAQELLDLYENILSQKDSKGLKELSEVATVYQRRLDRKLAPNTQRTRTEYWPTKDTSLLSPALIRVRMPSLCPEIGSTL